MTGGHLLINAHPLALHAPHDLPRLLVLELIEIIPRLATTFLRLLLPLLLLLHHDLVADHLLQDDVLEDAGEELVLHLN